MNIRHASFKHGWFYHYRVHLDKLSRFSQRFPQLIQYLNEMFDNCPHEHFSSGPRSSKLQLPFEFDCEHLPDHELTSFTAYALEHGRFKTAHSNVQVSMLEMDTKTVACEVPLWIMPEELDGFSELFDDDRPLTGHVDALSIDDEGIWIWDFKPNAAKEKYAHVQTWMYAIMLSKRTGIPLDDFRCGWFDENDCYVFTPPSAELCVPLAR